MRRKIPEEKPYFHFHNENPKNRIAGDCVVRAIAAATGLTWGEVLDGLYNTAKKYALMLNDTSCYEKYLKTLGWIKHKQPRKDDNTKYTGKEFCEKWQRDEWIFTGKENSKADSVIAHIGGHHVVCIKGGVIYDTWNSAGGCIGNYFTKGSEN